MRFMIDASAPRSVAIVLGKHGHEAVDVRDIGMGAALDWEIASYARERHLALLTRDFDFADVRHYPPQEYDGIVVLDLPDYATATILCHTLDSFLSQGQLLALLPGRLAIVEIGRVRLRPAP